MARQTQLQSSQDCLLGEISEEHLSEPGLVVIDITAADEATAIEAAAALGGLWLSSGPSAPGVRPAKPASRSAPMPTSAVHPCRRQLAPAPAEGSAATGASGAGSYRTNSGSAQLAGEVLHLGQRS
ncbi:DUF6207 family protein [Streptomyces tubercidicus]